MRPNDESMIGQPQAVPPFIKTLLILNGGAFIVTMGLPQLLLWFALWPIGTPPEANLGGQVIDLPGFWLWQLVTYGFLHGGLAHLLFNMFTLWMFGSPLENLWGSRAFAQYFMVCVIGAGLVQLVVVSLSTTSGVYPTVGASGGVFGILLAFGMFFPNRWVMLLFPPIPMKAKYLVIIFGGLELFFGISGTQSGVAHFAHLGGMAFGFALIWLSRSSRPRG